MAGGTQGASMEADGEFDYIVVGGGSSGCVTAGKLVGEHGARVLLLEAGGNDDDKLIKMPAGTFKMMLGAARTSNIMCRSSRSS